jgi:hypothetical protein
MKARSSRTVPNQGLLPKISNKVDVGAASGRFGSGTVEFPAFSAGMIGPVFFKL